MENPESLFIVGDEGSGLCSGRNSEENRQQVVNATGSLLHAKAQLQPTDPHRNNYSNTKQKYKDKDKEKDKEKGNAKDKAQLGKGFNDRRFLNPGIAKIGLTPHPPILAI